jgi:hypothetical protein
MSSSPHTQERVEGMSESDSLAWKHAVQEVASVANSALVRAQQTQGDIPKSAKMVLLPMIPAQLYLQALQANDYNVFQPMDQRRLRLLLLLARSWSTGVY